MRLGSKVDYAVDLLVLHQLVEGIEIADVHLDELVVRLVFYILEVGKVTGVGKLVKVDDIVLRILVYEESYDMTSNESGTAGDYYVFFMINYFSD